MPAALTTQAASRVPVYLDSTEMDSPAQVSQVYIMQYCLNAAARSVLKLRKFARVSISSAIRSELHWLPIYQGIIFKLCLMVYKCQHHRAPSYLSSLCVPLSSVITRRHMQAATQGDLNFPRTGTVTFGSRAFAVSGLTCRNSLPAIKSLSFQPEH